MRYAIPLAAMLLATGFQPASAQRARAKALDAKLKEIDAKLKELERLKAELQQLRAQLQQVPAAKKVDWASKIKFNGYFQARGAAREWTGANDDFWLRRMYVNMIITPNDRTMGVISWTRIGPDPLTTGLGAQTNTDWAMAFVDYKWNKEWMTRVGQAPDWFGLETAQGSSKRIALERAAILEGGPTLGSPMGLYFAGPWDEGIWLVRNPQHPNEPQAIFGYFSGNFRGRDNDSGKDVSIDLKWKPAWGEYGLSWLKGKYADSAGGALTPLNDRNATLGYIRWAPSNLPLAIQAEYVDGKLFGNDIDGGYAQLEYKVSPQGTAFVKAEEFDPNDANPHDSWRALHVGYSHWLDSNNELTLQYSWAYNQSGQVAAPPLRPGPGRRDQLGFQWQLGF